MKDNAAERIAKTIRAKARRKRTKNFANAHKREDFRAQILERLLDAELTEVGE